MERNIRKFEIFPKEYGFIPYISLVYVFFPLYYVSFEQGWKQVIGYLLIMLFLICYRQLYFVVDTKAFDIWLFIQLSLIFFLAAFFNSYYVFLGFFPANFISWYKSFKRFIIAEIYLAFCIVFPVFLRFDSLNDELFFLIPFIVIMIISPFGFRSFTARLKLQNQLKEANEQIKQLVKREERLRIARDLHDTLGHTLSLITLKSQLIEKLVVKDGDRARKEAREIEKTSRAALSQVRELVSDMRMTTVSEELLEVQSILEAANISYQLTGEDHLETVSLVSQNILSMCLREAVTNIIKHSGATICHIHIERLVGEVNVVITDNGIGLPEGYEKGNGLTGMKERLNIIDGIMTVNNNNGVNVHISIPVILQKKRGIR